MAQSQTTAHIKDVESQAQQAAGNDNAALKAQIETLKADLASITDLLGEIGARRKDETVDAARARYESAKRDGERLYEDARHRANDAQDQALEAIRRQPETAIGIAVAAGFLAGLITSRK